MKTLEEVIEAANKRFDERLIDTPTIFKECDRNIYLLHWLECSYIELYEHKNIYDKSNVKKC